MPKAPKVPPNPIERITPEGVQTRTRALDFDMIIYATGFDALTGAYDHIDIRGVGGQTLKDQWTGGAKTFAAGSLGAGLHLHCECRGAGVDNEARVAGGHLEGHGRRVRLKARDGELDRALYSADGYRLAGAR